MNMVMVNGLLLIMLFMWTSAEIEPETAPADGLHNQNLEHESRMEIQARFKACRDLDGKCIKTNRNCPNNRRLKTPPGKPYCTKWRHCCYPGPTTTDTLIPGMNKMACDIAGGKCQKIGEPCKGYLQKGDLWCEDNDYACCTPRGCTWGSVSYKNGSYLDTSRFDHCANYTCNDGKWELVGQQNCINGNCGCIGGGTNDDPGCILAYPNLPGLACNCTIQWKGQFPICFGTIRTCMITGSYFCDNTGTDKGFCMQGMGNCDGY